MSEDKASLKRPASEQSEALQCCYDYLNEELFGNKLPCVMLVLSRNANLLGGYYTPKRWFDEEGNAIPEIAVNANCLKQSGFVRSMMILLHEMLHHWQYTYGKPSRAGYHNKEYAVQSKKLGLQPFGPQGEEIGQAIDVKLISGGAAEKAIAEMPEEFTLPWMTEPLEVPTPSPQGGGGGGGGGGGEARRDHEPVLRKAGSRVKYTCPACGFNLWGKSGGHFECLDCSQAVVEMSGDAGKAADGEEGEAEVG